MSEEYQGDLPMPPELPEVPEPPDTRDGGAQATGTRVKILWGSNPDPGDEPVLYEFATAAERDAFLSGADEACGWHDYDCRTESDADWETFGNEKETSR